MRQLIVAVWMFAACASAVLMFGARLSAAELSVERSDRGAVVKIDGELFAEYLTRSGHQPAVWPIIGPTGKPMTRSFPAGPLLPGEMNDHPHHHSLWFTHGVVNNRDFWRSNEESGQDCQIMHREFVATESSGDGETAKIVTRNDWLADGKKVCEDERTLVFGTDKHGRWIDFLVTITASEMDLVFGESKEGVFGVRVNGPLTVEAKKGGHIVNSRSQENESAWGMFAEWVDNYGPVDGEVVGIAMFSHPDNFRHPTRWHARTYGLLAANPFGDGEFAKDDSQPKQGALTIPRGETLTLHYRVLFHAGDPTEAGVAEAYAAFAGNSSRNEQ